MGRTDLILEFMRLKSGQVAAVFGFCYSYISFISIHQMAPVHCISSICAPCRGVMSSCFWLYIVQIPLSFENEFYIWLLHIQDVFRLYNVV